MRKPGSSCAKLIGSQPTGSRALQTKAPSPLGPIRCRAEYCLCLWNFRKCSTPIWAAHICGQQRNLALKMKQLPPQFVSILAIYCFCMLQIPSSGFPRPLADPPDDLDIMQLEWLAYGATLSWQTKDNQDIDKRDSRTDAGDFTKKPRNGRNTEANTQ
ncbi:neuromedin-S isoform X2 [Panthera tigris]|uniref:neuromedin-S isoform X2 n=1 Tax=Panthera tigris TaxID=9694 RepID=UPI0007662DE4|nr:neuromedin-S isoform X2 [Panthera tigris]